MDHNIALAQQRAFAEKATASGMYPGNGGLAGQDVSARPTELGDLDHRLRNAGERVAMLANNILALGDRLYGSEPQADGRAENTTPHPGSGLGMIRMRIDTIEAWLSQAEQHLDRINNIA